MNPTFRLSTHWTCSTETQHPKNGEFPFFENQTEKLSPQPHVPVMFGLLKTNSEASFVSWNSENANRIRSLHSVLVESKYLAYFVKSDELILTKKCVGLRFGWFFHTLIWSRCICLCSSYLVVHLGAEECELSLLVNEDGDAILKNRASVRIPLSCKIFRAFI
jgi:hypothetical protein